MVSAAEHQAPYQKLAQAARTAPKRIGEDESLSNEMKYLTRGVPNGISIDKISRKRTIRELDFIRNTPATDKWVNILRMAAHTKFLAEMLHFCRLLPALAWWVVTDAAYMYNAIRDTMPTTMYISQYGRWPI